MVHSIEEIIARLEDLPLLPVVVVKIMSLKRDDDTYFEKILPLAQQDPSFALRIIKLANSSAFRPRVPINDLNTAVARIGSYQIAALVTSLAVMQVFVPHEKDARNLWLHSIQVAVIARVLAKQYLVHRINPAEAYLCGLMHDIGRFILFDVAEVEYRIVDESGWDTPEQLIDVEKHILGIDHTELGWRICKKWMMPAHVSKVVKDHHSSKINNLDSGLHDLTRLIQLADHYSVLLLTTDDFEVLETDEAISQIDQRVINISDEESPVSAKQLYEIATDVLGESLEHCKALGLQVD